MNMHRTLLVAAAAGIAAPAGADFETDFGVAWDNIGQLQVEFNFNSIEPINSFIANGGVNGDFTGLFSDEPGFANFEEDEADEDLFVVPDGTVVAFQLVSADPAFRVYDPFFDGALNNGDTFVLGTVNIDGGGNVTGFDDHPFWTVDFNDPSYNPAVLEYDVTFRLLDVRNDGTTPLASTEDITVTFTIPAPGSAAMLGLAGLAAARRRR